MPESIKPNRCIAVKKVPISPTSQKIRQDANQSATGSCYDNALSFIVNLQISGYDELGYVLGFRDNATSFEHAIIRVGTEYYDPANDSSIEQGFFSAVFELTHSQLEAYLLDNNYTPPTICDWIKWTAPPRPVFLPDNPDLLLF